jgi:Zn-dependent protease
LSIAGLLISLALLLICVSVHEFAHGWVAYKLGDNTAKLSGRLTLNPLAHIDPMGTIILPLFLFIVTQGRFVFGAAKPVPVNFGLLRNPKRDIIWVGLSGPAANFIFAILLSLAWRIIPLTPLVNILFWSLITTNVILGVFNLIPVPPLDGSRVLMGLLPRRLAIKYAAIEPYGFTIVMVLVFLGLFNAVVEPLTNMILRWLIMPF